MASGDTLLVFTPQAFGSGTGRFDETAQEHPVFDMALTETFVLTSVMPRQYAGTTGVTVYVHYAMSSASSNDIKVQAAFERIGDGSQNIHSGTGFAAAQDTGDITVPGTAGLVDIEDITFTDGAQMDSVAVGESFRLKFTRAAVAGTDATGDLELVAIEIKET